MVFRAAAWSGAEPAAGGEPAVPTMNAGAHTSAVVWCRNDFIKVPVRVAVLWVRCAQTTSIRYSMDMPLSKIDWTKAALVALERDGLDGVASSRRRDRRAPPTTASTRARPAGPGKGGWLPRVGPDTTTLSGTAGTGTAVVLSLVVGR